MVRTLLSLTLCALTCIGYSQEVSVEKSTNGIQVGFLGVWAHREMKLSNEITLRAEVGMDAGFWGGTFFPKDGYLITPVLALEPRWYYNLNKRIEKSKDIRNNSGSFLTVRTSYHPDWFVISNYKGIEVRDQISIIPTWGIRRNLGKHFTYEAGVGVGYQYVFDVNTGDAVANIHVRIGYQF